MQGKTAPAIMCARQALCCDSAIEQTQGLMMHIISCQCVCEQAMPLYIASCGVRMQQPMAISECMSGPAP